MRSRRRRRQATATDELVKIIDRALLDEATDVHLESVAEGLRVRYRIDGILHTVQEYYQPLARTIISCVKVVAGIDVAEKRRAQDGSFAGRRGERRVDFRVASSNTMHGEKLVVRILDFERGVGPLSHLGLPRDVFQELELALGRSHGIVIVSGV